MNKRLKYIVAFICLILIGCVIALPLLLKKDKNNENLFLNYNVEYYEQPMSKTEYFLALADTVNGTMHVSILPIKDHQAVAVMNVPVAVEIWQNPRVTVATSIYTYYESNALLITSIAGLSSRTPAGFPEKHGNGYYWHYHSISTVTTIDKNGKTHQSNAHAFFGLPA